MTDNAMAFADIGELGAALRVGRVSAVELAQFFIARLELVGPKLNSVVTILHDRALAEARTADADLAAGHDHDDRVKEQFIERGCRRSQKGGITKCRW